MDIQDVILKPLVSEKAHSGSDEGVYAFKVHLNANKMLIKEAVQKLFHVTVLDVNTMRMHGKVRRVGKFQGRRSDWKKAIVRIKKGESIQVFEGL